MHCHGMCLCAGGDDDVERDTPATRGSRRGNTVQYAVIHRCAYNVSSPTPSGLYHTLDSCPVICVYPMATVVYPHNPEVYEQIAPPDIPKLLRDNPHLTVDVINAQYEDELDRNGRTTKQRIDSHKKVVRDFANFLITLGLTTAYDQQIEDQPTASKTRWLQDKIKASDYVIFVITPSFLKFMNEAPEEELFFRGPYVHNLLRGLEKRSDGSEINMVGVFLDRTKTLDQVPTELRTGHVFELWTPFEQHDRRGDDLNTLVSLLTSWHW